MSAEVNTVFTVADKQSATVEKMASTAEKLEHASERAKKSMQGLDVPEHGAGGRGGGGGGAGGGGGKGGGLTAEERAAFEEARQERKLRKQRMLVQKVELQKEQVLHRVADTAMLAFIGKQNEVAEAMAKQAALAQGLGTSMSAFGGTIGKVGGVLTSLGSYGAIASLAMSGLGWVLDKFGVDVEGAMHEAEEFGAHLMGIRTKNEVARSMGFLSEADMKAAEGMQKMWEAESEVTKQLQIHANDLPKWPAVETAAAMQELHEKALALAKQMPGDMKLEEKIQKIEAAAKASLSSSLERKAHENELGEAIEKDILPHLRALPANATREQMEKLNTVIAGYAQSLVDNQQIGAQEAAAVADEIRAKLAERDSVANVVDQYKKTQRLQAIMDDQVAKQVKHLKVIPLHTTVARVAKFNDQLAQLAQHMAEVSHWTPEQTGEYLTKLKEAATEKQHLVFDFRGSRFDIRQQFADVDPDRIAVAFANDLAGLGERKVQSSFAPLWSV